MRKILVATTAIGFVGAMGAVGALGTLGAFYCIMRRLSRRRPLA